MDELARRARDFRNSRHAAVCDLVNPWAHGTVARTTRHPSYFDFNVVRVEEPAAMSVDALAAEAAKGLAGLGHRKLDFDLLDEAEPLRSEFDAKGWKSSRIVWMLHTEPLPDGEDVAVEEVDYDAVHDLRVIWHYEDFPGLDPAGYHEESKEVAMQLGIRVLAVHEDGRPIGFTEIEGRGDQVEVTSVFVHPDHRGGGRGTALTRAAIREAGDVDELWITADDEDRPKHLYARLGFTPAWVTMEFLLPPGT